MTAAEVLAPVEARYHAILSAAAASELAQHAAVMLAADGTFVKAECYEHEESAAAAQA